MENDKTENTTKKVKKPITKKWWFWVIIAVLAIAVIVGTTSGDKPEKETSDSTLSTESSASSTETAASSKDKTFALNETAVFNTIKVTANDIKESAGEGLFEPESGNVFVGVKFTIENISEKDQNISSLLLFDAYVDGVKCDYSVNANCAISDGTLDGDLAPGKKMVGYYSVEVPESWSQLELQVKSNWLSNSKAAFVFNK